MQGLTGSVNAVANIAGLIAGGLVYDEIGAQVFLLSAVGGGGSGYGLPHQLVLEPGDQRRLEVGVLVEHRQAVLRAVVDLRRRVRMR